MKEASFPKVSDTTHQRREHILQAATQVIAQDGLSGFSVRTVAKKAGCSRGLVEHYFRNKASLLLASAEWADEQYLHRVNAAVAAKSGLSALEVRLRCLLPYDDITLHDWKVRVAFWHQGTTLTSLEGASNRSFYTVYNAILKDLKDAQEKGEIAVEIPVRVTSEMLLLAVMGLCVSCLNNPQLRTKKPLDRRMTMFLNFLKSGNVADLEVGDPEVEY